MKRTGINRADESKSQEHFEGTLALQGLHFILNLLEDFVALSRVVFGCKKFRTGPLDSEVTFDKSFVVLPQSIIDQLMQLRLQYVRGHILNESFYAIILTKLFCDKQAVPAVHISGVDQSFQLFCRAPVIIWVSTRVFVSWPKEAAT